MNQKDDIRFFRDKEDIYEYLIKKFIVKEGTILLRGSMVNKSVEDYCDFDLEIYVKRPKKPYYEIGFVEGKICLISIWFGKYKKGKVANPPENVKVIHGYYFEYMKYIKDKGMYSNKNKIKRECQSVVDWMFKYLRSKDLNCLSHIDKRIR